MFLNLKLFYNKNMETYLDKIIIVIPAFNPDELLKQYIDDLLNNGVKHLLIVNDGSKKEMTPFFDDLAKIEEITVITHKINQGKGRALKTAFNYILCGSDRYDVVISEDDNQYTAEDTLIVAKKMAETNNFTLGERNINDKKIPFKSRLGNKMTSVVFKLMFGKKIKDTQTGLRGIPYYMLKECMRYEGEKFDYEMRMLIGAVKYIPYEEVKITKKYYEDKTKSNFRPFVDSLLICKIMMETFLRFTLSSLLSSFLDICLFAILSKKLLVNVKSISVVFISTIIARIISSSFNYVVNKSLIFKHHTGLTTLCRYGLLIVFIMFLSAVSVHFISEIISLNPIFIKVFVDFCLYFLNYYLQKEFVFKNRNKTTSNS